MLTTSDHDLLVRANTLLDVLRTDFETQKRDQGKLWAEKANQSEVTNLRSNIDTRRLVIDAELEKKANAVDVEDLKARTFKLEKGYYILVGVWIAVQVVVGMYLKGAFAR